MPEFPKPRQGGQTLTATVRLASLGAMRRLALPTFTVRFLLIALGIGATEHASGSTLLPLVTSVETVGTPLQGVSVDSANVRGAGTASTFVYDPALTNLVRTTSNDGSVVDLASGPERDTQTAELYMSGGVSLFTNSPRSLVDGASASGVSLGIGAAVKNGATLLTPYLNQNGQVVLVDFPGNTSTPLWTLASTEGVTGLDTFLRPGGEEGVLGDYAAAVAYADGTVRIFNLATGAQLGATYVVAGPPVLARSLMWQSM